MKIMYWIQVAAVPALAAGAAGCNILGPERADVGKFLTLAGSASSPPTGFVDGTINKDAAGCYRTADAETRTVIWPRGAYAEAGGTRIVVHEATGRPAGEVPGPFRLVGHRVADLQGQPVSADTRALAGRYCPGSYFIVEDIAQ